MGGGGSRHVHHHYAPPLTPGQRIQALNLRRQVEDEHLKRMRNELETHQADVAAREAASSKAYTDHVKHLRDLRDMDVAERQRTCDLEAKRYEDTVTAHKLKIEQLKERLLRVKNERADAKKEYDILSLVCEAKRSELTIFKKDTEASIETDLKHLEEHRRGIELAQADALGFTTVNDRARQAMVRLQSMIFAVPQYDAGATHYLFKITSALRSMMVYEFAPHLQSLQRLLTKQNQLFATMRNTTLLANFADEDEGLGTTEDYNKFTQYCRENRLSARQARSKVKDLTNAQLAFLPADTRQIVVEHFEHLQNKSEAILISYDETICKYSESLAAFLMWRDRLADAKANGQYTFNPDRLESAATAHQLGITA